MYKGSCKDKFDWTNLRLDNSNFMDLRLLAIEKAKVRKPAQTIKICIKIIPNMANLTISSGE